MPHPLKNIHVKVDPSTLLLHPELACRIAIICSLWTGIEDELAMFFVGATRMNPAAAAAILGRIASIGLRLDMIQTAFELAFPEKICVEFREKLVSKIRKGARERGQVVHCHWTMHPDHPDRLLRLRGLADPQSEILSYSQKDFMEIELRLLTLTVDLKEFGKLFLPYLEKQEPSKSYWKLNVPQPQEGDQDSPPDQKNGLEE